MLAQLDRTFVRLRPWKIWSRIVAYILFEGRPLTTRGRWINPLVFAGHRLWGKLPVLRKNPDPIFILGTGRSGTTVLGTILGLHPAVGYLNEPKALWQAALGDDDLIGSFNAAPGRYRMGAADADPGKVRKLRRSYNAFLRLSFSRQIVDKYPELIFRNGLLQAAFPHAKKIILIRSGTDTLHSIKNWSQNNGVDEHNFCVDWWGRDRRKWDLLLTQLVAKDPYFDTVIDDITGLRDHADMAAIEWIVTMREALRLNAEHPGKLLFIRYEDLTGSPGKTLQKISDFCGLKTDQKMQTYGKAVLRTRPAYTQPSLHPAIQPLFDETMQLMDYETVAH